MTYPTPNPGGRNKQLIRDTVKEWIDAQSIQGLAELWPDWAPSLPYEWAPEAGNASHACIAAVWVPRTSETRVTTNGPTDRGGIELRSTVELHVYHRTFSPDEWREAQNDYDRIIDAIKDCLRGRGRDLGRPDVIFLAAESPGGQPNIEDVQEEPVDADGMLDLWGTVYFEVMAYLPSTYPSA